MAKAQSNSRKVTIHRSGSFLSVAQGKDVQDFFSGSKRSIGSYFESVDSRRIGSGLTFKEETLLLPLVLDVPSEHPDFRKKLNEFYIDIDTQVPYDTGRTLEIGLESSNTDEVGKTNMPLNIMDYLRYRHALKHPQVALNKELSDGNSMKEFYIFDKFEVGKKSSKKLETQDQAMQVYQAVKDDANKVRQALVLLGINPDIVEVADHVSKLREKAEKEPGKFIEVLQTKDFEINYWIQSMLDYKIVKKFGNKYFDAETDKLLGNDLEETIYFFRDDVNSDLIGTMKARLQDKQLQ
jgi:hypothetical protein